MRKYIHYFRYVFGAIAILLILLGIVTGVHAVLNRVNVKDRGNTECLSEKRVFDYADKLTEKQEEKLEKLITKRELQTGCDIALVTIDESLKEYVKIHAGNSDLSIEEYAMVYADDFYDSQAFGYNAPHGDGVLYLDNWHREADGNRYTWFSTSGKAQQKYSNAMTNHLINKVCALTNISPYYSYRMYVNTVYFDLCGFVAFTYYLPVTVVFAMAFLITLLFLVMNLRTNRGQKTTLANTYVNGGNSHINKQEDILINEFITKRHIEKSASGRGQGGGSHMSGGGYSHGGGGGQH